MTPALMIAGLCGFAMLMVPTGLWMLREIRREERLTARIRTIHGQPPTMRKAGEPEAIRAAALRAVAAVGQAILRSGIVSARTLTELEDSLGTSALRGPQGVGIFIGAKILLLLAIPLLTWLLAKHLQLSSLLTTALPVGGGIVGLLLPDWLIGKQRKRYLDRLEQGLPDALDMMVICAQAGLGLGPAVIRVATELHHAHPEIATEFEKTANELQVMSDSRIAVLNLGTRSGLDSLKRLATTLAQTLQYGTPLSDALRVLSAEMRQEALTRREARAARLPVMLTLPTMAFILPCVFLIAGGPAIIQIARTL